VLVRNVAVQVVGVAGRVDGGVPLSIPNRVSVQLVGGCRCCRVDDVLPAPVRAVRTHCSFGLLGL